MTRLVRLAFGGPVRRQLMVGIALVHAVLMTLFVFDLVSRQRHFIHREHLEHSLSLAEGIARNSTSWVLAGDVAGLQELLQGFAGYPDLRYAMVVDETGKVLAHSEPGLVGRYLADAVSVRMLEAPVGPLVLVDDRRMVDVAAPVVAEGRLVGWARIATGLERSNVGLALVTKQGLIYTLAAIAIGILFAVAMGRSLTRGLYTLLGVAEATTAGRRDLRAEVAQPAELAALAGSFNRMLDSLGDRERDLRDLNAELELRVEERTADLAQANEDVRNFAYIVSHDLRAPLVNIQGFCGELRLSVGEVASLLDGLDLPADARARLALLMDQDVAEALDFIDGATAKMDRLINAVLKLSRLGRQRLKPEAVDLSEVVRSALATLGHDLDRGGIAVEVGALPAIVADRVSVEQIVGNLLSNAVKYLQPGRPGRLSVWADQGPEGPVLHLRDNGRGMAADDIPRAFELFRRIGRQDTVGEGMGLAYVQTLVRRLGGRIWCDSALGEGTTFHVALPWRAEGDGDTRPGVPAAEEER